MKRSTVTTTAVTVGLAAAAALAVCAPALAGSDVSRASGELIRYPGQAPVADAPEGATASVQSIAAADGRTTVTLHVRGMEPFAKYGAHAHVDACGETGGQAGPHFQHAVDPASPSVDPAFANPANEIWLDLTTNSAGNGHAESVVDWQFSPDRRPMSVILHEKHTLTDPGKAGVAGKRVACLTVPF